jgi:LDH2 family malate/lactate/ureidoglycolate dehydrogenase
MSVKKVVTHTRIPINVLKEAITSALVRSGYSNRDADIVTDTIMYAEIRANNQGLIKLVNGSLMPNPLSTEITCAFQSPVSAKIDGGQRIGMAVLSHSVDIAIAKTKISGISVVGCSNYSSATGALGVWAKKITDHGYIGIVMSQCPEMVCPHGSYEPIFGTNPIAIGVPTLPRAQILDMATSAAAYFGIKMAEKEGRSIPDDVAYDSNGQSTTDPAEALKGAIRVFDRSFKGSHLALMVELLAGALTGAAMEDKSAAKNWGSLVIVIDPAVLGPVEEFQEKAAAMCERVKHAKQLPGSPEMCLPGERGDAVAAENTSLGSISISDETYRDLLSFCA